VTELHKVGLRLPTEAQWEYGTRAGATTLWWTGNQKAGLRTAANLADETYRQVFINIMHWEQWSDGFAYHAPIGSFAANAFGLHDVHGNVWEWCFDTYDSYRYAVDEGDGRRLVPQGQANSKRICRGASYHELADMLRASLRNGNVTGFQAIILGVRPARQVD
jgi:formylglycine-generating enzyme required for sulfatase activity